MKVLQKISRVVTVRMAVWALALLSVAGCHHIPEYDNTRADNFEALWTVFDEHYCFFEQKGIDWDSVHAAYLPRVTACTTQRQLFDLCAQMVNELRDGHVNLSSSFATSYYREWWSGYPQNFDLRVVQQNYLRFQYQSLGAATYGILLPNVGYVRLSTFGSGLGAGNIDNILGYLLSTDGLIIDVRDNGGGELTNVEPWVSRFITERTLVGYICHKDGPGHNDFSEPYAYYYEPARGHILWGKRVVVLANRSTFSAANNFVSIMKQLPGVTVIGDVTGGGSGMPLSFELPIGWGVRLSAAPIYDAQGVCTEFGVEPTEGYRINIGPEDTAAGRDPILDAAIALIENY